MTGTIRCQPFEVRVKNFRIENLEAAPRSCGKVGKESRDAILRKMRNGDFVIGCKRGHTCGELTR